jgi:hypothetical protein
VNTLEATVCETRIAYVRVRGARGPYSVQVLLRRAGAAKPRLSAGGGCLPLRCTLRPDHTASWLGLLKGAGAAKPRLCRAWTGFFGLCWWAAGGQDASRVPPSPAAEPVRIAQLAESAALRGHASTVLTLTLGRYFLAFAAFLFARYSLIFPFGTSL